MDLEKSRRYQVSVYLYDISEGFAKFLAPILMGKFIEGVWHSSILAYDYEYYFDGDICKVSKKESPYGIPVKCLEFGVTSIGPSTFDSFVKTLRKKYNIDRYNLFKNNCNHFTEECLKFLTGKSLPTEIITLPSEIASTKFGKIFKAIREKLEKRSPKQTEMISFDSDYLLENPEVVVDVVSIKDFLNVVENERAVFIYVYRQTFKFYKVMCLFIEILEDFAHTKYSGIRFCTVDVEKITFKLSDIVEFKDEPIFLIYFDKKFVEIVETKAKDALLQKIDQLNSRI